MFTKDFFKFSVLIIVIIGALGYGISSLFQEVKFDVGDDEAEFAEKWINEIEKNPAAGRKMSKNSEQWFDDFIANRNSLGAIEQRYLRSKIYPKKTKQKQQAKTVKIIFETAFANAQRINEIVTLELKKSKAPTVTGVEYRYPSTPVFIKGTELQANNKVKRKNILSKAGVCSGNYDAQRFKYFKQVSINRYGYIVPIWLENLKKLRAKTGRSSSRKLQRINYRQQVPGIKTLEQAAVINIVKFVNNKKGREIICLKKDNQLEKPQWQVYFYYLKVK
jgi:uncharacterized protein DUF4019